MDNRDLIKDLRRDKVLLWLKNNNRRILFVIGALVVVGIVTFGYKHYVAYKAGSDSKSFVEAKNIIVADGYSEALPLLDELIAKGNGGYAFLSYVEKVQYFIEVENNVNAAVDLLTEMVVSVNLPAYYKDMITSISFSLRMNNNEYTEGLLNEIHKTLSIDNAFYFINYEMYAAILVRIGKYKEALAAYDAILNAEDVPASIKERSERVRSLVVSL